MLHVNLAMNQFKLSLFLILAILLLAVQMIVAGAALETVVKVEPDDVSCIVGETVTFNITIVDVQNLYGIEVVVYWNSSILQVANTDIRLGETDGALHGSFFHDDSLQDDRYTLVASSVDPAPSFNGSGNIVRIYFDVINVGSGILNIETQLYDYPPPEREPRVSFPIEHTTVDGLIVIAIPEFSNAHILIIFVVLTIVAAIVSKKYGGRRSASYATPDL